MPFAVALSGLNAASSDLSVTADNIANQIISVDSPILLNSMKCQRLQDGGTITPNF